MAVAAAAERARAAHSQLVAAAHADDGPLSIGGWVPPSVSVPAAAAPEVPAAPAAAESTEASSAEANGDGGGTTVDAAADGATAVRDGEAAATAGDASSGSNSDDSSSNSSDGGANAEGLDDDDAPWSFF